MKAKHLLSVVLLSLASWVTLAQSPSNVKFTTTAPDGEYGTGDVIRLEAHFDEWLGLGSELKIRLNTGDTITMIFDPERAEDILDHTWGEPGKRNAVLNGHINYRSYGVYCILELEGKGGLSQNKGKMVLAGGFYDYEETGNDMLVVTDHNGKLLQGFGAYNNSNNTGFDREPRWAIETQDGGLLVVGAFLNYGNNANYDYIVKFKYNTATDKFEIDTDFMNKLTKNNTVETADDQIPNYVNEWGKPQRGVLQDTDGSIYLVGDFSEISGVARMGMAKLNADGSLNTAFNPTGFETDHNTTQTFDDDNSNIIWVASDGGHLYRVNKNDGSLQVNAAGHSFVPVTRGALAITLLPNPTETDAEGNQGPGGVLVTGIGTPNHTRVNPLSGNNNWGWLNGGPALSAVQDDLTATPLSKFAPAGVTSYGGTANGTLGGWAIDGAAFLKGKMWLGLHDGDRQSGYAAPGANYYEGGLVVLNYDGSFNTEFNHMLADADNTTNTFKDGTNRQDGSYIDDGIGGDYSGGGTDIISLYVTSDDNLMVGGSFASIMHYRDDGNGISNASGTNPDDQLIIRLDFKKAVGYYYPSSDDMTPGLEVMEILPGHHITGAFGDPSGTISMDNIKEGDEFENNHSVGVNMPASKPEDAFITTWEGTEVNIPLNPSGLADHKFVVDWGDGKLINGVRDLDIPNLEGFNNPLYPDVVNHTFATAGPHTIKIYCARDDRKNNADGSLGANGADGFADGSGFPDIVQTATSQTKILSVDQWGHMKWTNIAAGFKGCTKLQIKATDAPILTEATNLTSLFEECTVMDYDFSNWDVSNITNLSRMFWNASAYTNKGKPLTWNTQSVTLMNGLFNGNKFNQDISDWNVSKVTQMQWMFQNNTVFNNGNQPLDWGNKTAKLQKIQKMFAGATAFNQDLEWSTPQLTDANTAFSGATVFNGDLSSWNTEKLSLMHDMFLNAAAFTGSGSLSNPPLSSSIGSWNVSAATDMDRMFSGATSFDQNLGEWDVSSVSTAEEMFKGATLSQANYDKLLVGWLPHAQNNVKFHGGNSQYCMGEDARKQLIDKGWGDGTPGGSYANSSDGTDGITDGGINCDATFVTTWRIEPGDEITIPHTGTGYDFTISWGDGTMETYTDADLTGSNKISHTYTSVTATDTLTVKIMGNIDSDGDGTFESGFPRIFFDHDGETTPLAPTPNSFKILSVEQWGDIQWQSMEAAFSGCANLTSVPGATTTETPDLSKVESMERMFYHTGKFDSDISAWDVSKVKDFSLMFTQYAIPNQFNNGGKPLTWNTESAETMSGMFRLCINFNQDVGSFNMSKVRDISEMFSGALEFNNAGQPLSNWAATLDSLKPLGLEALFNGAEKFNQSVSGWSIKGATSLKATFAGAKKFNQPVPWDVSKIDNMVHTFFHATEFDQDLSGWKIDDLTIAQNIIAHSGMSITNYDLLLDSWNTQAATLNKNDVLFRADGVKYCQGEEARKALIDRGWGDGSSTNTPDYSNTGDLIDGGKASATTTSVTNSITGVYQQQAASIVLSGTMATDAQNGNAPVHYYGVTYPANNALNTDTVQGASGNISLTTPVLSATTKYVLWADNGLCPVVIDTITANVYEKANINTSTISVSSGNKIANGTDKHQITVTVKDMNGDLLPNAGVVFSQHADLTFTDDTLYTNASGEVVLDITTTTPGDYTSTVKVFTENTEHGIAPWGDLVNDNPAAFKFVPDNATTTNSKVEKISTGVKVADGKEFHQFKATLKDNTGNPVPGKEVIFPATANVEFYFINPADVTDTTFFNGTATAGLLSDANGELTVYARSKTAGSYTTTATFNDGSVQTAFTQIHVPLAYEFKADAPTAATAKIEKLTQDTVIASGNNTDYHQFKLTVKDANGNPAIGNAVKLAATPGVSFSVDSGATWLPENQAANATIGQSAEILIFAKSTTAWSEFTTLAQFSINGTLTKFTQVAVNTNGELKYSFVAGLPDAGNSKIEHITKSTDVKADEVEKHEFKITLKDGSGNLVKNNAISFAATGDVRFSVNGSTWENYNTALTTATNASGEITVFAQSAKAWTEFVTLVQFDIDGDGTPETHFLNTNSDVDASGNVKYTFKADAPTTASAKIEKLTQDTVIANGSHYHQFKLTVKDAKGNAAVGNAVKLAATAGVSFSVDGGTTWLSENQVANATIGQSGEILIFAKSTTAWSEFTTLAQFSINGTLTNFTQVHVNASGELKYSFVAGLPDANNTTLEHLTKATDVKADETETHQFKITVKDASGNLVKNNAVNFAATANVRFSADGSSWENYNTVLTTATNASGEALVYASSKKAWTKFKTIANYDSNGDGTPNSLFTTASGSDVDFMGQVEYEFVADVPDLSHQDSYLVLEKDSSIADGTAQNKIEIYLVDSHGNPAADGTKVQIAAQDSVSWGSGLNTAHVATINGGKAELFGTSRIAADYSTIVAIEVNAGSGTYTAMPSKAVAADGKKRANPVVYTFVPGQPDLTKNGTYVILVKDGATANGTDQNKIEAHIVDAHDNPVVGVNVKIEAEPDVNWGGGLNTEHIVQTDADGVATFLGTSNAAGDAYSTKLQVEISGTYTDITDRSTSDVNKANPVAYKFVAGTPDPNHTDAYVELTKDGSEANGTASNEIEVYIVDAQGNPIAGANVKVAGHADLNWGSGLSAEKITQTDAAGKATFFGTSTVANTYSSLVQVDVNGTYTAIQSGTGTKQNPVIHKFETGNPDPVHAKTYVVLEKDSSVADGVEKNKIVAYIADNSGNPVANVNVKIPAIADVNWGSGLNTEHIAQTNASGVASFEAVSEKAGKYTSLVQVETTAGSYAAIGDQASVDANRKNPVEYYFVPGSPDENHAGTYVVLTKDSSIANGSDANLIDVYIVDAKGNPVAKGVEVKINRSQHLDWGNGVNVAMVAETDDAGHVRFTGKSTKAGKYTSLVQVKLTSGYADIKDWSSVDSKRKNPVDHYFVAGNPTSATAKIVHATSGTDVIADEVDAHKFEITVLDVNGNPVKNNAVTLSATPQVRFSADNGTTWEAYNTAINATTNDLGKVSIWASSQKAWQTFSTRARFTDGNGSKIEFVDIAQPMSYSFVAGPASPGDFGTGSIHSKIELVTASADIVADDVETHHFRGKLVDKFLNVVKNKEIRTTATANVSFYWIDEKLNPADNDTIRFGVGNALSGASDPAKGLKCDENGEFSFYATSLKAWTNFVTTVTFMGDGGFSPFYDAPQAMTYQFVAGAPNYAKSTVVAAPLTTPAGSNITITGTLIDINDNPCRGLPAVFEQALKGGTATNEVTYTEVANPSNTVTGGDITGPTDDDGQFIVYATSGVAASYTTYGTFLLNGSKVTGKESNAYAFTAGDPDPDHINTYVEVYADNARADGIETNIIHVHVADEHGNPVPGAEVRMGENGVDWGVGTPTTPHTTTTDNTGLAVFYGKTTVANTYSTMVTVKVASSWENITDHGGDKSNPVSYRFLPGYVHTGSSEIQLINNPAVADGVDSIRVRITLKDAYGNHIHGDTIRFYGDADFFCNMFEGDPSYYGYLGGPGSDFEIKTTSAFQSDGVTPDYTRGGVADLVIRSYKAGDYVKGGGVLVNGNPTASTHVPFTFLPAPASGANSKVSVSKNNQTVGESDSLKVELIDASGNALDTVRQSTSVVFAATANVKIGTANVGDPYTHTLNVGDTAVFEIPVMSTVADTFQTAVAISGPGLQGSPVKYWFKNSGASDANSQVIILNNGADIRNVATEVDTIKVIMRDTYNNPLTGVSVKLSKMDSVAMGSYNRLTSSFVYSGFDQTHSSVTDENGEAIIVVKSKMGGAFMTYVQYDPDGFGIGPASPILSNGGNPVELYFVDEFTKVSEADNLAISARWYVVHADNAGAADHGKTEVLHAADVHAWKLSGRNYQNYLPADSLSVSSLAGVNSQVVGPYSLGITATLNNGKSITRNIIASVVDNNTEYSESKELAVFATDYNLTASEAALHNAAAAKQNGNGNVKAWDLSNGNDLFTNTVPKPQHITDIQAGANTTATYPMDFVLKHPVNTTDSIVNSVLVNISSNMDYGDAPDSYKTLFANNGARHIISADTVNNQTFVKGTGDGIPDLMLGTDSINAVITDAEADALAVATTVPPTDNNGSNGDGLDENGIVFLPNASIHDNSYTVSVRLSNATGKTAYIGAWLDMNRNGQFEDSERITHGANRYYEQPDSTRDDPSKSDLISLTWNNVDFTPAGGLLGPEKGFNYLRIRVSTNSSAIQSPYGLAPDGEVEDYMMEVLDPGHIDVRCGAGAHYENFGFLNDGQNGEVVGNTASISDISSVPLEKFANGWMTNANFNTAHNSFIGNGQYTITNRITFEQGAGAWVYRAGDYTGTVPGNTDVNGDNPKTGRMFVTNSAYVPVYLRAPVILVDQNTDYVIRFKAANPCNITNSILWAMYGPALQWDLDGNKGHINDNGIGRSLGMPSAMFGDNLIWYTFEIPFNSGLNDSISFNISTDATPLLGSDFAIDEIWIIPACDVGDLPDPNTGDVTGENDYRTKFPHGPAHATLAPGANIFIGDTPPDKDEQLSPSPDAGFAGTDGDDGTNVDDEDGLRFRYIGNQGKVMLDSIIVHNNTTKEGYLYGWIDFNRNGELEHDDRPGAYTERARAVIPAQTGTLTSGAPDTVSLEFNIPLERQVMEEGEYYVRLRVGTNETYITREVTSTGDDGTGTQTTLTESHQGVSVSLPVGTAADGEVEDHKIRVEAVSDYGDAPVSFKTSAVDGGPEHVLADDLVDNYTGAAGADGTPDLVLGSFIDAETDAKYVAPGENNNYHVGGDGKDGFSINVVNVPQPDGSSKAHNDTIWHNDEDGLVFLHSVVKTATSYSSNLRVRNLTGKKAYVSAWLDYNRNGTFEQGERVTAHAKAGNQGMDTIIVLTWNAVPGRQLFVPYNGDGVNGEEGFNYLRVRTSTDSLAIEYPTGQAPDGEVEDYRVEVLPVEPINVVCKQNIFFYDFGYAGDGQGTSIRSRGVVSSLGGPINTMRMPSPARINYSYKDFDYYGGIYPQDKYTQPGQYVITDKFFNTDIQLQQGNWAIAPDHTYEDDPSVSGRMLVIDAGSNDKGKPIFILDVVKLSTNTVYEFGAYFANITKNTSHAKPEVRFEIRSKTGEVLHSLVAENLDHAHSNDYVWQHKSIVFNSGSHAEVSLWLINNKEAHQGNNLAIDDIYFSAYCDGGDLPDNDAPNSAVNTVTNGPLNYNTHYPHGPAHYTPKDAENVFMGTAPDNNDFPISGIASAVAGSRPIGTKPNGDLLYDGDDYREYPDHIDDEDALDNAFYITYDQLTLTLPDIPVTNNTGKETYLYGWVDVNHDGELSERERAIVRIPAGFDRDTALVFEFGNTPAAIAAGDVLPVKPDSMFVRLRTGSKQFEVKDPVGFASDGEVEDHYIKVVSYDFGDAPASYKTTLADGGAAHIVPDSALNIFIGSRNADITEGDGKYSADALGDDNHDIDDEDGLTQTEYITVSDKVSLGGVRVENNTTDAGFLFAWLDINRNGSFDKAERIKFDVPAASIDTFTLNFDPISTAVDSGEFYYVRLRVGTTENQVDTAAGVADNGEVEDFRIKLNTIDLDSVYKDQGIRAEDFAIHIDDATAPAFTETAAKDSAEVYAYDFAQMKEIPRADIKVDAAQLTAIQTATEVGAYPLTFETDSGAAITVTVTVYNDETVIDPEKDLALTASNFIIHVDDLGTFDKPDAVIRAKAKAWMLSDTTKLTLLNGGLDVDATELGHIVTTATAGVYDLTFTATHLVNTTDFITKTIKVSVIDDSTKIDVEKDLALKAGNYIVHVDDLSTMDNHDAVSRASAKAWVFSTGFYLTIANGGLEVNPTELDHIVDTEKAGAYPLTFKAIHPTTTDFIDTTIIVTVIDDHTVIGKGMALTADNFIVTVAEANALDTEDKIRTEADASAWLLADRTPIIPMVSSNWTDVRDATEAGIVPLTFKAVHPVNTGDTIETTILAIITDGDTTNVHNEQMISGSHFAIHLDDVGNLVGTVPCDSAKIKAYDLTTNPATWIDYSDIKIDPTGTQLSAITGATSQGIFPLTFETDSGASITVQVTVYEGDVVDIKKGQMISGSHFAIHVDDVGNLTGTVPCDSAKIFAYDFNVDATIPYGDITIDPTNTQLSAITGATSQGIFPLTFETDSGASITIQVTVYEGDVVDIKKGQMISGSHFAIHVDDVGNLVGTVPCDSAKIFTYDFTIAVRYRRIHCEVVSTNHSAVAWNCANQVAYIIHMNRKVTSAYHLSFLDVNHITLVNSYLNGNACSAVRFKGQWEDALRCSSGNRR